MMSSIHLSNFVILCQQFFARGTYWLLHLVTLSQRVTCKSSKKGETPKSCEVVQSCLIFQILVGSIRCLLVPKGPGGSWNHNLSLAECFAAVLVSHGSLGLNTWC